MSWLYNMDLHQIFAVLLFSEWNIQIHNFEKSSNASVCQNWLIFSISNIFFYVVTTSLYYFTVLNFFSPIFHASITFNFNQKLFQACDRINLIHLSPSLKSPKIALLHLHNSPTNFDYKLKRYIRLQNNAPTATHIVHLINFYL